MSRDAALPNLMPGLGERLRAERERLGLTQEELATRLGIARKTVINHENDAHSVPLEYVDQLGQLGADCHFLLFGRRFAEYSGAPDPDILQQVLEWAETLCKDRKGKPFSLKHTARFMSMAYIYLAGEHVTKESGVTEAELIEIARRAA